MVQTDVSPRERNILVLRKMMLRFEYIITLCCLASAMLPVLVIWILFSTPKRRRQPIFWIQLAALVLSIAAASLDLTRLHSFDFYEPGTLRLATKIDEAEDLIKLLVPPLTDTSLIFALLAFYPSKLASRWKRMRVIALPVFLKVPRLALILVYLYRDVDSDKHPNHDYSTRSTYMLRTWDAALQLIDNAYVTITILSLIYGNLIKSKSTHTRSTAIKRGARLAFQAFTMSFAPAVLLQTAYLLSWLIPLIRHEERFHRFQIHLETANIYVSLTFSCLATSWSSLCDCSATMKVTTAAKNVKGNIPSGVKTKSTSKPSGKGEENFGKRSCSVTCKSSGRGLEAPSNICVANALSLQLGDVDLEKDAREFKTVNHDDGISFAILDEARDPMWSA